MQAMMQSQMLGGSGAVHLSSLGPGGAGGSPPTVTTAVTAANGGGAAGGGAAAGGAEASAGGGAPATNSQARGNTQTHPTTATQTRSTSRPHVHFSPTIQGIFISQLFFLCILFYFLYQPCSNQ